MHEKPGEDYQHIINSMRMVEIMEEKVDRFDDEYCRKCIEERNYEKLELYVMELLTH